MLRNMINNIKKSVCKANEDFIFGTDFADKMGWNELDDICLLYTSPSPRDS